MRRMRALVLAGLGAVLLALPAHALAVIITPPGKSGADQYFETIPTSHGNSPTPADGAPQSPPGAINALGHGRAGTRGLDKLGKSGQAAASLARETAPVRAGHAGAGAGGGGAGGAGGTGSSASPRAAGVFGGSALSGVFKALSGSDLGGLGFLFPVLLLVAVLAAGAIAAERIIRSHEPVD